MKKIFLAAIFSALCVFAYAAPVPKGYGGVTLGMGLDEAKKALLDNGEFGYNGDADVSLLPGDDRILIETDASAYGSAAFLSQCWFQFYEEKLYTITINFNPARLDHYSIYSSLCKKYGEPAEFSPERSVWYGDGISMSLERPLSIKYIDTKTAEKLQQKSLVEKTASEKTRDMFLEGL